jgi:hypothetical protein
MKWITECVTGGTNYSSPNQIVVVIIIIIISSSSSSSSSSSRRSRSSINKSSIDVCGKDPPSQMK